MSDNTVLIGIGFAGCKILSKVNNDISKVFIDTDKNVQEQYSGLRVGEKTCGEYPSGGNVRRAEMSAIESKNEILQSIENFDNWVIIAPFGGGTSCGTTKKIVEFGYDLKKTIIVLTSMPLPIEGNRRTHLANDALFYTQQLCDVVKLEFDEISQVKIPLNEIFNLRDERYLLEISKIISD